MENPFKNNAIINKNKHQRLFAACKHKNHMRESEFLFKHSFLIHFKFSRSFAPLPVSACCFGKSSLQFDFKNHENVRIDLNTKSAHQNNSNNLNC